MDYYFLSKRTIEEIGAAMSLYFSPSVVISAAKIKISREEVFELQRANSCIKDFTELVKAGKLFK